MQPSDVRESSRARCFAARGYALSHRITSGSSSQVLTSYRFFFQLAAFTFDHAEEYAGQARTFAGSCGRRNAENGAADTSASGVVGLHGEDFFNIHKQHGAQHAWEIAENRTALAAGSKEWMAVSSANDGLVKARPTRSLRIHLAGRS